MGVCMDDSVSMFRGRMFFSGGQIRSGCDTSLAKTVALWLQLGRVQDAVVAIHSRPRWEHDPDALFQFGVVLHWIAPVSSDRAYAYHCVRALCKHASTVASDDRLRSEALALMGATYFEEGNLDSAAATFAAAMRVDYSDPRPCLGALAVACANRDRGTIVEYARQLTVVAPRWRRDSQIVGALARDPDFAFLRADGTLLHGAFGAGPDQLQALDRQLQRELVLASCMELETDAGNENEADPSTNADDACLAVVETCASLEALVADASGRLFVPSSSSTADRLGLRGPGHKP
jgi:hypothetical protein